MLGSIILNSLYNSGGISNCVVDSHSGFEWFKLSTLHTMYMSLLSLQVYWQPSRSMGISHLFKVNLSSLYPFQVLRRSSSYRSQA